MAQQLTVHPAIAGARVQHPESTFKAQLPTSSSTGIWYPLLGSVGTCTYPLLRQVHTHTHTLNNI